MYIWCSGEVVQVANGESDRRSDRCTNLLPAGAVRFRWPEDIDFDEKETFTWMVLHPNKWRKDQVNSWRWDPEELTREQGRHPSLASSRATGG